MATEFNKIAGIIKDGAIFIGDAHDNALRVISVATENRNINESGDGVGIQNEPFLRFLQAILNGQIAMPPQLFIMGDMFDFLTPTQYCQQFYGRQIAALNKLAQKCEIFYFEGNHDFGLKPIFKGVKVFEIGEQPAIFKASGDGDFYSLAHGDIFIGVLPSIALRFLRLGWFLRVMNEIDKAAHHAISKWILTKQASKKLDYKITDFKALISRKINSYKTTNVVEAHYHQNRQFEIDSKFYINLPCFAFEQRYFVVECHRKKLNFKELRSPNV